MLGKKEKGKKLGSIAGRNLERKDTFKYELVIEGVIIGVITGFAISALRIILENADILRFRMIEYAHTGMIALLIFLGILALIAITTTLLVNYEPMITGSGIPQVEGELKGQIETIWWKVLIGKILGGVLAIGGGLALGREGPSVQIGAMVGKGFSRKTGRLLTEERMLITCGAGAGLSAAFGAPLAGAIFSIEELHKNFSNDVLITTMAAAVSSDFVVANIMGLKPIFNFQVITRLPLRYYWAVVLLGVILGVFGVLYNNTLNFLQNQFEKMPKRIERIGFAFAVVAVMAFVYPMVLGSGNNLVNRIAMGEFTIGTIVVLLIAKYIFSTMSFSVGVPGGIFLPLLVIGALTGGTFSRILGVLIGMEQQYIVSFVIIGMAAYFSAIVRAPITGVILITEMTGDFSSLLALAVASLVAFIVADMLGGIPVYTQLLQRMIKNSVEDQGMTPESRKKVIFESNVYIGSFIDGRQVKDLNLPIGSLIVSVNREGKEIVPDGNTKLLGGDDLSMLCCNCDIATTEEALLEQCQTITKE